MNEQVQVSFRIIAVDLVTKVMLPRPKENFTGEVFAFDIKTEASVHTQNKHLLQFVTVKIREDGKELILGTFTIVCIFDVPNLDEQIKPDENDKYIIQKDLDLFTRSVAISTMRGVMWSELKSSYLHFAVLPVIDVSTMSHDDHKATKQD